MIEYGAALRACGTDYNKKGKRRHVVMLDVLKVGAVEQSYLDAL